jgi:hypothetical protein
MLLLLRHPQSSGTSSLTSATHGEQNDCVNAGETDCPDLAIDCMCGDKPYIFAGLCCVSDACGAASLVMATNYVADYCESWNVEPPDMDRIDCANIPTDSPEPTQSTSSATSATSSATDRPGDDPGADSVEAGGANVPLIAGAAGGAAAILLIVAAAVFFFCRKRKGKGQKLPDEKAKLSPVVKDSTLEPVEMFKLSPSTMAAPSPSPSPAPAHQSNQQWQHGGTGTAASPLYPELSGSHQYQQYPTPPRSPYPQHQQPSTYPQYPPPAMGYQQNHGPQGTMAYGQGLASPPPLPPRQELQGMSFVTHHPYPTEMPTHEPGQHHGGYR